ncbi:MAG: sodium-translocating pyrophosphatase [Candidatus Burarchaeum sp.]|nr:sodium-translocating pyrophosphatase [Candidatus Burarchaeum sp.]MDO8340143.1 sodium-translocating pyrophosphatase [Candidatus Burarchaeum sp.]
MDWGELARTTLLPFVIAIVIVVIGLQLLSQAFDITTLALYFAPAVSILALLYGFYLSKKVLARDTGTPAMQKIAGAIQRGSVAYINRQFKTILPFTIIIALLLWYALGIGTALTFLLGAFLSGLAGYYGMYMAVRGNVRAASAARRSLREALDTAFSAGTVNGMLIVGLCLLGVSLIYVVNYFMYIGYGQERVAAEALKILVGFGFGANLMALFMRVGGGIYTKGADVGADLVGKIEKGMPEDDPRNPAVIADNVGDNVGDCAGMGADIFESYAVTIVAAMILGDMLFGVAGVAFPLLARGVGIIAAIIGTLFVKALKNEQNPMGPINRGFWLAALSAVIFWYFLISMIFQSNVTINGQAFDRMNLFYAAVVGMVATVVIGRLTEYYTDSRYKPVKEIAKAATTGAATTIISGLAYGMQSTVLSVITVALTIVISYNFAGSYGIALAGMGMLATTGIIVSMDTYGPIADNANGIGEMAKLDKKARKVMSAMDAVGNTTKALTKGFAITSAAVAAVALFATYVSEVTSTAKALGNTALANSFSLNLVTPPVFVGLLLGGIVPFLFSSLTINAVSVAAYGMIEEVRRQFKAHPGILKGTEDPDYAKCVDISTGAALRELIAPAILAVASPILVGYLLGVEALGGFLAGAILCSLFLALFMCNAGGAWDNAKKFVEDGNYGGKGTPTHAASVVGDTVGDPLKDTSGPALNPLIKILNVVALLFVGFFVANSLNLIKASATVAGGGA